MIRCRFLLVPFLLTCAGCTQLLFVERYGECAEVYGRNATQPIYLDSDRVGKLWSRNHHTGRPLSLALIDVGSELRDIGVENITITADPLMGEFSGCAQIADGERFCALSNQRLVAAGTTLEIGVRSDIETWQILRATEEYIDRISHECARDIIDLRE